ncbi:MAG: DNA repair protein RecO [Clostridia bacterium]|jgi:DNA repair protein RecO (recombination protein O)|nr:DNA repair protein RecO [Clostridia bacterium]
MGTLKTNGIIIQESNMGDYDKMLTMLTPGLGKIGCAAKGARRNKSSLLAGSQFLCFGEYMLYKGRNTYNINSCETIEIFYNIRTDLEKLQYANYINKIIYDVTNENENSYKILQLYLNTLYTISETNKDLELVTAIFKFRLLSILGFTPWIKECVQCKKNENILYFSIKNNGFKCGICGKQDTSIIQISQATKDAIKYIILAPPKKLYSFNISDNSIKELEIVSKIYLNEKLEKQYKLEA